MSFDRLVCRVLCALRGNRYRKDLSKELGRSINQYSRWESAWVDIGWKDFAKICEIVNAPLAQALKDQFGFMGDHTSSREVLLHLIDPLVQQKDLSKLAEITYSSKRVVKTWTSGRREPSLTAYFKVIEHLRGDLGQFLHRLTGVAFEREFVPGLPVQQSIQVSTESLRRSS